MSCFLYSRAVKGSDSEVPLRLSRAARDSDSEAPLRLSRGVTLDPLQMLMPRTKKVIPFSPTVTSQTRLFYLQGVLRVLRARLRPKPAQWFPSLPKKAKTLRRRVPRTNLNDSRHSGLRAALERLFRNPSNSGSRSSKQRRTHEVNLLERPTPQVRRPSTF